MYDSPPRDLSGTKLTSLFVDALKSHRRDEFIEWIKGLLAVSLIAA